jgi:hypothetical protein
MATEAQLNSYFQEGDKPSSAEFAQLIRQIFINLTKIEKVENYAIADMADYLSKSPELTDEIIATTATNQKRKFSVTDFITMLQGYMGRNETPLGSINTATEPKSPADIGDYYIASVNGDYSAGNFDLTGVLAGDKLKATGANFWYNEGKITVVGDLKIWVDSINGLDTNTGLKSSQAVKTLTKAKTLIQAGCTVFLARGSRWQGDAEIDFDTDSGSRLDGVGNELVAFDFTQSKYEDVSFESYSGGARPVIDLSKNIPNAEITKQVGFTNIYILTLDATGFPDDNTSTLERYYRGLFENEIRLIEVIDSSVRNSSDTPSNSPTSGNQSGCLTYVDGNAGTFYSQGNSGNTITYYFHATGSSNPITNAKKYDIFHAKSGFVNANENYENRVRIKGVHVTKPWDHSGAAIGWNMDFEDCEFSEFARHGMLLANGYSYKCLAHKTNTGFTGSYIFHSIRFFGHNEGRRIEDCVAISSNQNDYGFGCHGSGGDLLQQTSIKNTAIDCFYAMAYSDNRLALIDNFKAINCEYIANIDKSDYSQHQKTIINGLYAIVEQGFVVHEENTVEIDNYQVFGASAGNSFISYNSADKPDNSLLHFKRGIFICENDNTDNTDAKIKNTGGITNLQLIIDKESYWGVSQIATAVGTVATQNYNGKPRLFEDMSDFTSLKMNGVFGAFRNNWSGSTIKLAELTKDLINANNAGVVGADAIFSIEKEVRLIPMVSGTTTYTVVFAFPILQTASADEGSFATFTGGDAGNPTYNYLDAGTGRLAQWNGSSYSNYMPVESIIHENSNGVGVITLELPSGTENDGEDITLTVPVIRPIGTLLDMAGIASYGDFSLKPDSLAISIKAGFIEK